MTDPSIFSLFPSHFKFLIANKSHPNSLFLSPALWSVPFLNIYSVSGIYIPGFPGDSAVKNPSANAGAAGDVGLIPWSGRSPGEGNGNSLQYACLGKSHGQRSLADYNP